MNAFLSGLWTAAQILAVIGGFGFGAASIVLLLVAREARRDAKVRREWAALYRAPAEDEAWAEIVPFRPAMGRPHLAAMQARKEAQYLDVEHWLEGKGDAR